MKWVSLAEPLHPSLRSPCAMPSIGWSGVKLTAIGLWSSGNTFSGVMNHASPSGSAMDNSVFATLWQQFGESPFLFQHDNVPVHKARSVQKWFWRDRCGRTWLACTEPWPQPLWDELERRLRAGPNRPTSVPDLTKALVAEWKQVLAAMFQLPVESLPRRVEAVLVAKGGPTPYQCPCFWKEIFDNNVSTFFWSCSVSGQYIHPLWV